MNNETNMFDHNEIPADASLLQAIENICSTDAPADRMQACLAELAQRPPADTDAMASSGCDTVKSSASATGSTVPAESRFRQRLLAVVVTVALSTCIAVVYLMQPQTSLAEVAHAVSQKQWVHLSISLTGQPTSQTWYSPASNISASKSDQWIEYHDHRLKVYHSFDISERVLYRVPSIGRDPIQDVTATMQLLLADETVPNDPLKKLALFGGDTSGLTVQRQSVRRNTRNGQQWLDYTLKVQRKGEASPMEILFRVDAKTKLLSLHRVSGQRRGKAMQLEVTFDYPEDGPTSIYDLGVDRDVKLVDRVPKDDLARLLAGIEAGRTRFDNYRAIVVTSTDGDQSAWQEFPDVIHCRGNRLRRDMVVGRNDVSPHSNNKRPADNEDMTAWWKQRISAFRFRPTRVTIGTTDHHFEFRTVSDQQGTKYEFAGTTSRPSNLQPGQWFPAFYAMTPQFMGRPPIGIPSQTLESEIVTDPKDGPDGTVLLRVRRSGRRDEAPDPHAKLERMRRSAGWDFWIDTDRGYLIMRMDTIGPGNQRGNSTIVDAVAQSPRGHWYPTRIRRRNAVVITKTKKSLDQIIECYVDFDVDLPDKLFDPRDPLLSLDSVL